LTKLPSHVELKQLHELLAELSRLERVVDAQKIVFFQPVPKGGQSSFFDAQCDNVRLVLGSNRSGKTACGVVEAIAHSLGFRPWLPEDHPLRIVRLPGGVPIPVPNVGRIIAQNYEQAIRQTIMTKYDEWAPKSFIKKIEKNTRGIPVAMEWYNGSVVYLMSNDQDDMAFEGPAGHWFWADEPIDYRKYTGLRRGLVDHNGHCWLTMTPLSQPWINDIIVSKANDPGTGVSLFKFSIWDNCIDNGGHLPREAIESFLSDLREDELEARLHGNFLHLAGLVYKRWEPREPYWVNPFDIPLSWPRVMVCDPHPRKPIAMLWAACSPSNIWYVYRAIFDRAIETVAMAAELIKRVECWEDEHTPGSEAENVVLRIIDWSANEKSRSDGSSVFGAFAANGLPMMNAKKQNAQFGYDAIHEALRLKNEWDVPGVVVFNNCAPVKQNFMNFCYDEWATNRQRDLKGDKQDYRKTNDDFIDCIRYIFQHRLSYHMLANLGHKQMQARESKFSEYGNGAMFHRDGLRTGYGIGA